MISLMNERRDLVYLGYFDQYIRFSIGFRVGGHDAILGREIIPHTFGTTF